MGSAGQLRLVLKARGYREISWTGYGLGLGWVSQFTPGAKASRYESRYRREVNTSSREYSGGNKKRKAREKHLPKVLWK